MTFLYNMLLQHCQYILHCKNKIICCMICEEESNAQAKYPKHIVRCDLVGDEIE